MKYTKGNNILAFFNIQPIDFLKLPKMDRKRKSFVI